MTNGSDAWHAPVVPQETQRIRAIEKIPDILKKYLTYVVKKILTKCFQSVDYGVVMTT